MDHLLDTLVHLTDFSTASKRELKVAGVYEHVKISVSDPKLVNDDRITNQLHCDGIEPSSQVHTRSPPTYQSGWSIESQACQMEAVCFCLGPQLGWAESR